MKNQKIGLLALLMFTCLMSACRVHRQQKTAPVNISIFADHIGTMAKQKGISFTEAAQQIQALGYRGVDVWVHQNPEHIRILDSLGFQHASAIVFIDFCSGEQPEMEERTIRFMKENKFDKVLLVPGFIPDGSTPEAVDSIRMRIVKFWQRGHKEGLDILLEDYDRYDSPCCSIARLDSIYRLAPKMGHVFDTGNYFFVGEDEMEALDRFQKRIHHIHMKDRLRARNGKVPPVGTGDIHIREVVQRMKASGYQGWYTAEFFGCEDMYQAAATSIQNFMLFYNVK